MCRLDLPTFPQTLKPQIWPPVSSCPFSGTRAWLNCEPEKACFHAHSRAGSEPRECPDVPAQLPVVGRRGRGGEREEGTFQPAEPLAWNGRSAGSVA